MKANLEEDDESLLPDPHKLRRFALATGLILLAYVLAGGHIRAEVQLLLIEKFDRPWMLVAFLAIASAYAAFRYWYYAIRVPLTRKKIREYLKTDGSILAFVGRKQDYYQSVEGSHTGYSQLHSFLTHKSPAGLDPYDLVVGAGKSNAPPEWDVIRALIARQFDSYFPGITWEEIKLGDKDTTLGTAWASIGKLKRSTQWHILIEDMDLYLPVWLNGIALLLLIHPIFIY